MRFFYRKLIAVPSPAFPKRKNFQRPIIPVSIISNKRAIRYEALIDSGSDYNIFPAGLGKYLGINVKSGKPNPAQGFSGNSVTIYFIG